MQLLLRDTRKKIASFPCSCMKFRVRIIKQRSFSKKTGARKQLRMWVTKLRVCSRMIGTEPTQNKPVKVISLAFSLFPSTCKRFQTKYSFTDLKKLQDELVTYLFNIIGQCLNLLIFSDEILSTFWKMKPRLKFQHWFSSCLLYLRVLLEVPSNRVNLCIRIY